VASERRRTPQLEGTELSMCFNEFNFGIIIFDVPKLHEDGMKMEKQCKQKTVNEQNNETDETRNSRIPRIFRTDFFWRRKV
jgi:hypothetical protein